MSAVGGGDGAAFDAGVHLSETARREGVERQRNKLKAGVEHTWTQLGDAQAKLSLAEEAKEAALAAAQAKADSAAALVERRVTEHAEAEAVLAAFEEEHPDGLV